MPSKNTSPYSLRMDIRAIGRQEDEEFLVAFGAEDGGWDGGMGCPAGIGEELGQFGEHAVVLKGVADDAAFADLAFAHFKLGLDQGDDPGVRLHEFGDCRNHDFKGYEGYVYGDQIDGFGQHILGHAADVHPFDDGNAGVLTQPPGKLPVSDIHGIDAGCPVLQQAIREAPGGCPHIEAYLRACRQVKRVQRLLQLQASPADVGARPACDAYF